ncbi:uncharacterized protein JCM6883_006108 [Sporobolomyces salmoneus]|uniref:uncharacterized protein n=1 Tax=Sporobolomyces salmoneus TaxID=183962 RepID=UPI003178471D
MGLWSRTYVCCAVPLYNSGIYCILAQFLIISLVTGVLCFASPSIITVTTPNIISYVLGVLNFVITGWQLVGFFGVYRDRVKLFKTYSRINTALILLALLLSLAIIIISAVKHNTAIDTCQRLFSTDATGNTGEGICNVWTWVQVGIMGLLFVIVGLCELYFLMYSSIYSSEQKLDHARYNSVYSTAAEEIRQSGLWDGYAQRNSSSFEGLPPPHAQHGSGLSKSSGLRNELSSNGAGGEYMESREYLDEYGYKGEGEKVGGDSYVSGYRDDERYEYTHPQQLQQGYYGNEGGGRGFRPPQVDSTEYEHQLSYGPPGQQRRY